ncbi:MAG: hypothetical protein ACD_50C00049G0003 [uncultured bacterium]|nr:MAG: hypothetical protein ACD_50C00049G0003 [uncultured bacterium]OGH13323.1 MAG: hypothetical protein A2687_05040 [Candidatus Levybacteria bacterium RIFCSPHIGHO2_01_FULL_38_26]
MPNEVKITCRESIALVVTRILGIELLFGFLFFLTTMFISFLSTSFQLIDIFLSYTLVLILFSIVNALIIFFVILQWYSRYSEVTKKGVIKHEGILYKRKQTYACSFIETITLHQSFIGTILDFGTLELYDPALKEQVYLHNIPNPKKYNDILHNIFPKNNKQYTPIIPR